MMPDQLTRLNDRFQQKASDLAEILPGGEFLILASAMIRSAQRLEKAWDLVVSANSSDRFYGRMEAMEEEMDEMIGLLDQLDLANRKQRLEPVTTTIKRGYDMLSMYSICTDRLLNNQNSKQGSHK